MASKDQIADE